jgi:hypothetical protein
MSTHGMTGSVFSNERWMNLLERSTLNKGTAFTDAERAAFGLEGRDSRPTTPTYPPTIGAKAN